YPADWYIEDNEKVPQDIDHQEDEFILQSTLLAWKKRTNQDSLVVGCELACRWDEIHYRVGVDPDVYVIERPPGDETGYVGSLKTWLSGNHPPILAIEIVSKSRPGKDYKYSPEKHDLLGTFELWVFDPHLYGYTESQPPVLLQVFQRETNDVLVQKYAGDGPYWSDALDAWVMVIDGDLVIANDRDGKDRWPTLEEEQRRRADAEGLRADAEALRADAEGRRADAERLAKEEALARVAKLEALLSKQS
ncbi:MAG TPA: Uma2 family endonuclease, partial [Polyangium sp.]|nr:Uma2 family endonuclease [Polyangium sp.]